MNIGKVATPFAVAVCFSISVFVYDIWMFYMCVHMRGQRTSVGTAVYLLSQGPLFVAACQAAGL